MLCHGGIKHSSMQCLVAVSKTSNEYLKGELHRIIRPPLRCPHCQKPGTLWALGYYQRYISLLTRSVTLISVRRFRCVICRKTVSLLPLFAQPYRTICNDVIHAYFSGRRRSLIVIHWEVTLQQYWKRFAKWLPQLAKFVGNHYGLSPPISEPPAWWFFLTHYHRGLNRATSRLVRDFSITPFGRYRCHTPNRSE